MYTVKEVMESGSIAVIGASHDLGKPGAQLLNLLRESGFRGQVAGVNPRGGEVHGFRLYRNVGEIPFRVDLAALIIPPASVPPALEDCARKGVKGVVIASEGFAETGSEGKGYQEEIARILRTSGMRGFGPNTMGIVNTETGLATAYFASGRMLKPGSVGFAAQSGIFVGALLRYLSSFEQLRVSKAMGLGNKVDVDESDALRYLTEDPQTRIIGMYLEDVRDGRRFMEAAKEAVRRKPFLLVKGGRSPAGARAIASHTASMAVDDAVLEGALRQTGVLRMSGVEELVGTIVGFRCMPLPKGDRIAFITYSGAQAIMSVDAASRLGLELASFGEATRERISRVIATPSKARNPIDFYPDINAHGFEKTSCEVLRGLLDDDGVHGIIFISFAASGPEMYTPLLELIRERANKPVFFSLMGTKDDVDACRTFMDRQGVPAYLFPEEAVRVFATMRRYALQAERDCAARRGAV
jgi:acetate---CoA ligase (ADP-forming)